MITLLCNKFRSPAIEYGKVLKSVTFKNFKYKSYQNMCMCFEELLLLYYGLNLVHFKCEMVLASPPADMLKS